MNYIHYVLLFCVSYSVAEHQVSDQADKYDFYSYNVLDINENVMDLEQFRGKVSLVVNVASECGFTDGHYRSLVRMQHSLGSTGKFTVLAFPCNQFGNQEPKGNADIIAFVETRYKNNFPIMSKINVLGNDVPAAWKYLIDQTGNEPNWNFWKYLVNYDGRVLASWGPWTEVEAILPQVQAAVNEAVKAHGPPRPTLPDSDNKDHRKHEPHTQSAEQSAQSAKDKVQASADQDDKDRSDRGFGDRPNTEQRGMDGGNPREEL